MLESRKSYGWGYAGAESGYEWELTPDESDPCYGHYKTQSGTVYRTKAEAVRAGQKWLRETKGHRSGTIEAVKSEGSRYEY